MTKEQFLMKVALLPIRELTVLTSKASAVLYIKHTLNNSLERVRLILVLLPKKSLKSFTA